jgi:murein DD-endopeptidase MepM/ murein hydrolase activator NlpD
MEGDEVAKNVFSRLSYYIRFFFSLLQIAAIRGYDFLISMLSMLIELCRKLVRFIKTSRDHYTVLIVPQKKSMVRKISASSSALRLITIAGVIVSICVLYIFYEFLTAKREIYELYELRKLSVSQQEQIHQISSKIGYFEKKLESLKEYDQKIRSMADMVGRKKGDRDFYRGVGGPIPDGERSKAPGSETAAIGRMSKSLDQLIQEASQQEKSFQEIVEFLEKRRSILAITPSIWPVEGWVTSWFGVRKSPFSSRREFHSAIDIAARSGKEVVAPADGIVADVEHRSDMGNTVTLDHGNGITTAYAHLLRSQVPKGKTVRRGEVIGYVGSTGRSTGPHLHYSVHLNGVPVNPRKYLP